MWRLGLYAIIGIIVLSALIIFLFKKKQIQRKKQFLIKLKSFYKDVENANIDFKSRFSFNLSPIPYYYFNDWKKRNEKLFNTINGFNYRNLIDKQMLNEFLEFNIAYNKGWQIIQKFNIDYETYKKSRINQGKNEINKVDILINDKPIKSNSNSQKVKAEAKKMLADSKSEIKQNNTSLKTDKITSKIKVKKQENLPEAIDEEKVNVIKENKYVNYITTLPETTDNYPIYRCPKDGCIIRTHRFGNTKRRGFKEESFQNSIQKHFGSSFIVSGNVRLNTGKETRPFEPDIAVISNDSIKNIRIDIEIDEPYAGITRQPTHCKGEDFMRDTYFVDRGWIVIRFSEYQVHTQELSCLKHIAEIIKSIDKNYIVPANLNAIQKIKTEKLWDIVQAQKWEKEKYRENYLNHTFKEIPEEKETTERDFNEQEINEEKLVKPTVIGKIDKGSIISYNKKNTHVRDYRVKFYPEPHIYTIDNVPVPSASTVISKFFPEFDSYGKASTLGPSNPLYGLSVEEIVQIWNQNGIDAANKGTLLHEQIENYFLNQPFSETEEFHLFRQFINDHPKIEPYRSEWRIFDDTFNIAGTIDLIARNNNGFDIYDWKRSKKVVDTYSGEPIVVDTWGNCGVGKLSEIEDTSYNKYCLQQGLYRYILEKNYGLRISKMYLIVLYPDYKKYYKVETPYWKERIEYILNTL